MEKSRDKINDSDKWNLKDLYPSVPAWKKNKKNVEDQLSEIAAFKNTLGLSGEHLFTALQSVLDVQREFYRLYAYAMLYSDEDTRLAKPLAMKQELLHLQTRLNRAISYLEPEILAMPGQLLNDMFAEYPQLEIYRQFLDDIQRRKAHTLNENEEKLIAEAGLMSDTAHESYNILSNADLPYPEIELTDGTKIKVDATNYSLYRASNNRDDRIRVFDAFFEVLQKFKRTFGTQLYGEIKKNMFYKNVRNYESCLHSALDRNNIQQTVYRKLIDNVNKHLGTLHRYLKIRKRIMGLKDLTFYDVYPSLVKEVDLKFSYNEAQDVIKNSLAVLGDEYNSVLEKSFRENWIDVYPGPGKRSGAYMEGIAYDVHPYILMNYKDKYEDMSTLTHELGHAMHSYFSNRKQPFVNSQYPIFLAEVASTVNEALLIDYQLKQIDDPDIKLSLLGSYLDAFRGTLFRQTQFAEYELLIHEKAETGQALTGDDFTDLYLDLFKKYYGVAAGITAIDDKFGLEWAYIPHFYYNFYVFQYSTSFTATQAIVERILNNESGIIEKYTQFLSSGCSEYAIPTLQKVGVDMTSDEPFELTIGRMNTVMDEIEAILNRKEAANTAR